MEHDFTYYIKYCAFCGEECSYDDTVCDRCGHRYFISYETHKKLEKECRGKPTSKKFISMSESEYMNRGGMTPIERWKSQFKGGSR